MKKVRRLLAPVALLSVLVLAVPSGAGAVSSAQPRGTLTCQTYVSNIYPKQRSSLLVYVHTKPKAAIRATAHFKTGNVLHSTRANKYGNAAVPFKVGRAMKGYVVHVVVRVTLSSAHGYCTTKFTPK